MYSLKAVLQKSPVIISGAVIAVVNFCIIQEWIDLSAKGVASLNTALVLVLGLFVVNTTVNQAGLDEVHEAVASQVRLESVRRMGEGVPTAAKRAAKRPLRAKK